MYNALLEKIIPRVPIGATWHATPYEYPPWNQVWLVTWGYMRRKSPVSNYEEARNTPVTEKDLVLDVSLTIKKNHVYSFNIWNEWVTRPYLAWIEGNPQNTVILLDEPYPDWEPLLDLAEEIGFTATSWISLKDFWPATKGNGKAWSLIASRDRYRLYTRAIDPVLPEPVLDS